jgi:hypothetical protein
MFVNSGIFRLILKEKDISVKVQPLKYFLQTNSSISPHIFRYFVSESYMGKCFPLGLEKNFPPGLYMGKCFPTRVIYGKMFYHQGYIWENVLPPRLYMGKCFTTTIYYLWQNVFPPGLYNGKFVFY